MICTSAFSTGNDYAHVRLTIHYKMALSMSELIQAQGRSGRDGRTARCFIIPTLTPRVPTIDRETMDHKGQWYAYEYVYAHGENHCLRYGTTRYIDGTGLECKEDPTNKYCSVCRAKTTFNAAKTTINHHNTDNQSLSILPTSSIAGTSQQSKSVSKRALEAISSPPQDPFVGAAHTSKKQRVDRLGMVMHEANRMRQALNRVKDHGCGMCLVMDTRPTHVRIYGCPTLQAHGGFAELMQWKKQIRYPPSVARNAICWKCHVPSCSNTLHGDFEGQKTKCEWEDVVIPTLMGIWACHAIRERAEQELGVLWSTFQDYTSWLVGAPSDPYYSRVMEVFLWYVERVVGSL